MITDRLFFLHSIYIPTSWYWKPFQSLLFEFNGCIHTPQYFPFLVPSTFNDVQSMMNSCIAFFQVWWLHMQTTVPPFPSWAPSTFSDVEGDDGEIQLLEGDNQVQSLPKYSFLLSRDLGPHFLCWISAVVPFNTWLISSWEENKCCYKLSKCTNWQLFSLKMTTSTILSEINLILYIFSVCNNIYFLLSLR